MLQSSRIAIQEDNAVLRMRTRQTPVKKARRMEIVKGKSMQKIETDEKEFQNKACESMEMP